MGRFLPYLKRLSPKGLTALLFITTLNYLCPFDYAVVTANSSNIKVTLNLISVSKITLTQCRRPPLRAAHEMDKLHPEVSPFSRINGCFGAALRKMKSRLLCLLHKSAVHMFRHPFEIPPNLSSPLIISPWEFLLRIFLTFPLPRLSFLLCFCVRTLKTKISYFSSAAALPAAVIHPGFSKA